MISPTRRTVFRTGAQATTRRTMRVMHRAQTIARCTQAVEPVTTAAEWIPSKSNVSRRCEVAGAFARAKLVKAVRIGGELGAAGDRRLEKEHRDGRRRSP